MLRHIVMWKLDDSYSAEEKNKIKAQLKEKLMNLGAKIPSINYIMVHYNDKKVSIKNYDLMLDSHFDSKDALKEYINHEEHKKVVEYMSTLKLERAAIDYTIV